VTLVTITPTYRITIPKEIREQFNLKPGQKVYFETNGKILTIRFGKSIVKEPSEVGENLKN